MCLPVDPVTRGEFNDASALERWLFWYHALHITNKDRFQNNQHPRMLELLNSPLGKIPGIFSLYYKSMLKGLKTKQVFLRLLFWKTIWGRQVLSFISQKTDEATLFLLLSLWGTFFVHFLRIKILIFWSWHLNKINEATFFFQVWKKDRWGEFETDEEGPEILFFEKLNIEKKVDNNKSMHACKEWKAFVYMP